MPSPCCAKEARHERGRRFSIAGRRGRGVAGRRRVAVACTARASRPTSAAAACSPISQPALGEVSEIRLSKGDGSRTTLRKAAPTAGPWSNASTRPIAARVRELALGLAGLKVVERKTSDPANYAKLGVEAPDTPDRRQHAGRGGRGQEDLVADRRQGRRRPRRLRAQAGRSGQRAGRARSSPSIRIRSAGSTGCSSTFPAPACTTSP